MRRVSLFKGLTCFMLIFLVSGIILPVSAHRTGATSLSNTLDASLKIISVEYTDADEEGYENDIVGCFNILLNGAEKYTLNIDISLTLPSGFEYTYSYSAISCLTTLHCTIYLFDHATESGDYTFSLTVYVHTTGAVSDSAEYIFDPPEGSGDTDPCVYLLI